MSAINDSITIGIEQTIGMDDIEKLRTALNQVLNRMKLKNFMTFKK